MSRLAPSLWMTAVLVCGCGSSAPTQAPGARTQAGDDDTAPNAPEAPESDGAQGNGAQRNGAQRNGAQGNGAQRNGAECASASDCHYDDPCMPSSCEPEPTPTLGCTEARPPAGPCACVEGRCEMQVQAELEPPSCTSDETCFFDDACVPTACSTIQPADVGCDETALPPGDCRCIAGACVMRRHQAAASEASCGLEARCGFRIADGTCAPGQDDERVLAPPGVPYPLCGCGTDRRCTLEWMEPVPCDSVDDCWIEERPAGRVPVRRPRRFRGRDFRPCRDGEILPTCEDGFCTVNARFAFSC